MREVTRDGTYVWSKAVQTLLAEQMKFALNAAVDMLPHNANLHLWKKKPNDSCPLCGERQTLVHTLNNCKVALDQRRYNKRHDEALQAIVSTVAEKLPSTTSFTTDLGDTLVRTKSGAPGTELILLFTCILCMSSVFYLFLCQIGVFMLTCPLQWPN